jgi:hypothetical protein
VLADAVALGELGLFDTGWPYAATYVCTAARRSLGTSAHLLAVLVVVLAVGLDGAPVEGEAPWSEDPDDEPGLHPATSSDPARSMATTAPGRVTGSG